MTGDLLRRYMKHVRRWEGTDFTGSIYTDPMPEEVRIPSDLWPIFTAEEVEALQTISRELDDEERGW